MGKIIDLTGQKFGNLTVLSYSGSSPDKKALWLCQCECGKNRVVMGKLLRNGSIVHCGCQNKTTVKNLVGETFGRLTVIERAGSDTSNKAMWKCICQCGEEVITRGSDLIRNKVQSCGCYKTEKLSKNLAGERFGKLLVVSPHSKEKDAIVWECMCECGNTTYVTTNHLTTGNTQSCGCLSSKGEKQIAEWLRENGIEYKQQYMIEDLLGKNDVPLRFDFAILQNGKIHCLIEYQGVQHYKNVYNLAQKDWEYTLARDQMKKDYCQKFNIPLIEIRYDENIERALGEFFNADKSNN